jgi:hypothetical protein
MVALVLLVALDVGPTTATAEPGAPDSSGQSAENEDLVASKEMTKESSALRNAREERARNEVNTPLPLLDEKSEVRRPYTPTPDPAPRARTRPPLLLLPSAPVPAPRAHPPAAVQP